MPAKITAGTFIGLTSVLLAGCVPYVMNYVYLDGPGVDHRRSPCYDGAPVGVAYERNDVQFVVTLEPHGLSLLKEPYLKLRAPRNVAISIPDPIALITFRGEGPESSVSVVLKAAPLDWQGRYVAETRRNSPLAEYRFMFTNLPEIGAPGSLQLPIVLADGVPVESPVFTFERRRYAGIVPVNC